MQTIYATFEKKNLEQFTKAKPTLDGLQLVDQDTTIHTSDGDTLLYKKIDNQTIALAEAIATTAKMHKSFRTRGAATVSSIFGVLPRNALRTNFCRFSAQSKTDKQNFWRSKLLAENLFATYKQALPEQAGFFRQCVDSEIDSSWFWNDSPFLTVNFNVNFGINYHRDAGNMDQFSNVLIINKGVVGGELAFPELGVALHQGNGFLAVFNGKKYIHGVCDMKKTHSKAIRASIVCYTMNLCKNCLPFGLEKKWAQKWSEQKNKSKWQIKAAGVLTR